MSRDSLHAHPKNSQVDAVKELRLRQWARTHYITSEKRPRLWHPIVLDEMLKMDEEHRTSLSTQKIYAIDRAMEHKPHSELWARATSMVRYQPMEMIGLPTELFFG